MTDRILNLEKSAKANIAEQQQANLRDLEERSGGMGRLDAAVKERMRADVEEKNREIERKWNEWLAHQIRAVRSNMGGNVAA